MKWVFDEESLYISVVISVHYEGGPPALGVRPPFLLHSQYICCKCIIEGSGKIPRLIDSYKLFLSDVKDEVKIFITSCYYLMDFWV